MAFKAIERKAQALLKTSHPVDGYDVMGALLSLAGDAEGMREQYRKAMLLPHRPGSIANKILSYINLGFFSEAAKDLGRLERPEEGALSSAINLNAYLCRFGRVAELLELWNSLHPDDQRQLGIFPRAAAILERAKIDHDAFLPVLDVIGRVLRESRLLIYHAPVISISDIDGNEEIFFQQYVLESPEYVANLESKMVGELFASGLNLHENVLRFGFRAVDRLADAA